MDELQNDFQEQTEVVDETTQAHQEEAPSDDKLKQLEAQKVHWRNKAIDPATGKTYKALFEESKAQSRPQQVDPNQFATKEELKRIELQNMGHDAETINSVMAYAKGVGKDPLEVLNDPFVKSAVEAKQAKLRQEQSTPSPSSRSASVPLPKPYAQMSDAERREHFERQRQTILRK